MKDLKSILLPNPEQQDELKIFFSTYIGLPTNHPGNKIVYGGILTIEFKSQTNKIKSIFLKGTKEEIDTLIKKAVEALASNLGLQIHFAYVHTSSKIEKYWRHENNFQILPAPASAPQPNFQDAEHAFLLEYSFPKSSNSEINSYRSACRERETILLLNSLLKHGLHLRDSYSRHAWVLSDELNEKSKYMQLGYFTGVENHDRKLNDFSSVNNYTAFDLVNSQDYYTISSDIFDPFVLPDFFTKSIIAFENLDYSSKGKFLRASYWTQVASKSYPISRSAAFCALVSSIEVFMPTSHLPPESVYATFKKGFLQLLSKYQTPAGPTKEFRDFVEKYAPGIPESSRKKLYDIRSKITHGGALLPEDENNSFFQNHLQLSDSRNDWELLYGVVQVAQINWLHAQKQKS